MLRILIIRRSFPLLATTSKHTLLSESGAEMSYPALAKMALVVLIRSSRTILNIIVFHLKIYYEE